MRVAALMPISAPKPAFILDSRHKDYVAHRSQYRRCTFELLTNPPYLVVLHEGDFIRLLLPSKQERDLVRLGMIAERNEAKT